MEADILVPGQPFVVLGLVGVPDVEDHVDFFARILCNQVVHEIQKLSSAPALVMSYLDLPRDYLQGSKQCSCAVPLELLRQPSQRPAIG
jgi:hypothetical protein